MIRVEPAPEPADFDQKVRQPGLSAIAELVAQSPKPVISRARQNLARLKQKHPDAGVLFDTWHDWLELPPRKLIFRLLDLDLEARDMRQVSPFSGVLTAGERARILSEFRREEFR